jgi:hypothetical protein
VAQFLSGSICQYSSQQGSLQESSLSLTNFALLIWLK